MMEASGVHRLEVLTRQAVGHVPPLTGPVGPHGFLKEASTCRIEVARYVSLNDPLVGLACATGQSLADGGHGVIGASIWPESIGMGAKVGFPYGFQDHPEGFLYNPVQQDWD